MLKRTCTVMRLTTVRQQQWNRRYGADNSRPRLKQVKSDCPHTGWTDGTLDQATNIGAESKAVGIGQTAVSDGSIPTCPPLAFCAFPRRTQSQTRHHIVVDSLKCETCQASISISESLGGSEEPTGTLARHRFNLRTAIAGYSESDSSARKKKPTQDSARDMAAWKAA